MRAASDGYPPVPRSRACSSTGGRMCGEGFFLSSGSPYENSEVLVLTFPGSPRPTRSRSCRRVITPHRCTLGWRSAEGSSDGSWSQGVIFIFHRRRRLLLPVLFCSACSEWFFRVSGSSFVDLTKLLYLRFWTPSGVIDANKMMTEGPLPADERRAAMNRHLSQGEARAQRTMLEKGLPSHFGPQ